MATAYMPGLRKSCTTTPSVGARTTVCSSSLASRVEFRLQTCHVGIHPSMAAVASRAARCASAWAASACPLAAKKPSSACLNCAWEIAPLAMSFFERSYTSKAASREAATARGVACGRGRGGLQLFGSLAGVRERGLLGFHRVLEPLRVDLEKNITRLERCIWLHSGTSITRPATVGMIGVVAK